MKKILSSILFCLFLFLTTHLAQAQIYAPVKWTFSSKKINDTEAELTFKASIDKGWHVYSQFIANDGPVPTSFKFEKNKAFDLVGKVTEGKPIEQHDVNFDMDLKFFEGSATFKQIIKIKDAKNFSVKGSLEYMSCDNSKCLPPETVDFTIDVAGITKTENTKQETTPAVAPENKDNATPTIDSNKKAEEVAPTEKKKN